MSIDPNSPEFMFGQILQRLEEGDRSIDAFKKEIATLIRAINQLPCAERERRLNLLETLKLKINGATVFKSQAFVKFKYTLLVSLLTAVLTCVLTILAIKIGG